LAIEEVKQDQIMQFARTSNALAAILSQECVTDGIFKFVGKLH